MNDHTCPHCGGRIWVELDYMGFDQWDKIERCINCGREPHVQSKPPPSPLEPGRRRRGPSHAGIRM